MASLAIRYTHDGNEYKVTQRELYSVLSSTEECLSPAFNMQIQMLIQLVEIAGEEISVDSVLPAHVDELDAHFPGTTVETLRTALKSYHVYATNMYYI